MQPKLMSSVSAALLVIGIGGAQANDKVTFSLNWVPYGLHYGIFAAEAQGYYREAGLDLDIQRGYGSGDTVKRTATGAADIGMADMASPLTAVPSSEPGVYSFKTELAMAGRWLLSIAAKVQGEVETVVGKITFRAIR